MNNLASYAIPQNYTLGRINHNVINDPYPYLTDRNRIIQSMSFRRLEYKTQVFVNHAGDHFRTRLTHSLEVAQIAITISRLLRINEGLSENIALCHDIGHPPFGHAGEEGLNQAALEYGGFNHNFQTIKVLTLLEQKYPEFDGLDLTLETLEGVIKHNGPINKNTTTLPEFFQELLNKVDFSINKQASLEAQVAALADDIAYCSHDIDDGIRAGIFTIKDLKNIKALDKIVDDTISIFSASADKLTHKIIRNIAKLMIEDVVNTTQENITKYKIYSIDDVRNISMPLVEFSNSIEEMRIEIKKFLMEKVYRNYHVNRMSQKGKKINEKLFAYFMQNPNCLPTEWQARILNNDSHPRTETIIDYIAGMTDRYAAKEYKTIFDPNYF